MIFNRLTICAAVAFVVASGPVQASTIDAPAVIKDLWTSKSAEGPDFQALHQSITLESRNAKWAALREEKIRATFASNSKTLNSSENLSITCGSTICEVIVKLAPSYVSGVDTSQSTYSAVVHSLVKSSSSEKNPVLAISGDYALAYVW